MKPDIGFVLSVPDYLGRHPENLDYKSIENCLQILSADRVREEMVFLW